ncbi:uncharacterized protein AMSG_08388, partial [Thecamonas trahens ATCC 50062]
MTEQLVARVTGGIEGEVGPEHVRYAGSLSGYSLGRLRSEPAAVQGAAARLAAALEETAQKEYPAFVHAAATMGEVRHEFEAVSEALDGVVARLPAAVDAAHHFAEAGRAALDERRRNALVLAQAPQLVELLEAPALMESLVRAEAYDDALALREFVVKAGKKLGHIPLVASLVGKVGRATALMVGQIRAQLESDVKVPACITLVSLLRRVGLFSPRQLRVMFLAARNAFLRQQLEAVPTSEAGHYVLDMINAYRVTALHVVTQYSAVFADDLNSDGGAARAALNLVSINYGNLSVVLEAVLKTVNEHAQHLTRLSAQPKPLQADALDPLLARLDALESERKAEKAAAAAREKELKDAVRAAEAKVAALEAVVTPLADDVSNVVALAAGAMPRSETEDRLAEIGSSQSKLADRLTVLANSLPETYATKAEVSEMGAARKSPAPARPGSTSTPLGAGLGADSSGLAVEVEGLASRMADLEGLVGGVEVPGVRDAANVLEARADAVHAVVSELEAKMAILSDQVAAAAAAAATGGSGGGSGDDHGSAAGGSGDGGAMLAGLSSDVSKLKMLRPEIDTLKHSLASLRSTVADAVAREADTSGLLETHDATIKNLDAAAAKSRARLAELESELALVKDAAAPASGLDSLKQNMASLKSMLNALEAESGEAKAAAATSETGATVGSGEARASSAVVKAALDALRSRVSKLEARAASGGAAVATASGGSAGAGGSDALVQYRLDASLESDDAVDDLAALQEPLAAALREKAELGYVDEALNELDERLRSLANFASDKLEALANAVRSRASIRDMQEMEEDLLGMLSASTGEGSYTTAGRLHFRCLSCNRSTATVSGPASSFYTRSLTSSGRPATAAGPATSSFGRAGSSPRNMRPPSAAGATALYPTGVTPTALFGVDNRVYHGRVETDGEASAGAGNYATHPRPRSSQTMLNRPPAEPEYGVPGTGPVDVEYTDTYEIR